MQCEQEKKCGKVTDLTAKGGRDTLREAQRDMFCGRDMRCARDTLREAQSDMSKDAICR